MSTEEKKGKVSWFIFPAVAVIVFILGLLASSIMERRVESRMIYMPKEKIDQFEPRNEKWGEQYPNQYDTFMKTAETSFKSKHNSSSRDDMLEMNPNLVILWAGYGFSKDYNAPRGHSYAIKDIRETLRTGAPKSEKDGPMPATCWACKSTDVSRYMNEKGITEFYQEKWAGKGHEVVNPIGCNDCHDGDTMALRISRPALLEGFESMGLDLSKATHQDKRTLVCAQCHVEYYFKDQYLVFPWAKGTKAENMEEYFDEVEFADWVHPLSKAKMIKAQHPGYELWKEGIHAQRGVSCADCHMPYVSKGGVKFTDHQINSPLAKINRSCQNCHRQSEAELIRSVASNQDKVYQLKMSAEKILVKAHLEAKAAWDAGATEAEMAPVLDHIRHAQWRWDYATASHGAAFHAPQEVLRILGTSIEKGSEARRLLTGVLVSKGIKAVDYPDVSTKEKAQKYLGMDIEAMKKAKKEFLETLVPEWEKKAKEREATYGDKKPMTKK
ncbi:MAG: ammonia-forming cytochrome c nitrite reductase [Lentisphaeraceae bacterium]|nr:ammonia-forming cytochrome c nitrite reductase [Lentisphaeraceae bacterium]